MNNCDETLEQNRFFNATNPAQGTSKKVLCVCSAGLLRSPTMAKVLSQDPFNFNTRSAGLEKSFALVPINSILVHWADEIVTAEQYQVDKIKEEYNTKGKKVVSLNISDSYEYNDPKLVKIIKERYEG